jgi:hypothetical protein
MEAPPNGSSASYGGFGQGAMPAARSQYAARSWQARTAGYIDRGGPLSWRVLFSVDLRISDPVRDGRSPEHAPGGRTGALT